MRDKADLGQAIVFIADMAELSQKRLAKALNVSAKTISAWKTGQRKPNPGAMQNLPKVLGVTMAEIEAVAAFHGEWRQKMKGRRERAADVVGEVPVGLPLQGEDVEREIVRTFVRLVSLVQPILSRRQDA
jgi:transcriptional regulator with XRE-family HTH domain